MHFIDLVERIDKVLFMLIHNDSDHDILDKVIPYLRNAATWIPLYLFMLIFAVKTAKEKVWQFVLLTLLTFACTDIISASLLKPLFSRIRPCYDAELSGMIRNIINCGGMYSLPSSHATNHFGLAFFWYKAIFIMTGKRWGWLWVWAAIVGYAQVYVGKHYPMDIVAGAILGCLIASVMAGLFEKLWNSPNNNQLRSINYFIGNLLTPKNRRNSGTQF